MIGLTVNFLVISVFVIVRIISIASHSIDLPVCERTHLSYERGFREFSVTDLIDRGLHQAMHVLALVSWPLEICNITSFLWVKVHLWGERCFRWDNRLVVASEDFALLFNYWHLGDILSCGLSSILAARWWSAPKHCASVFGLSGHEGNVWSATILVETVYSTLEISWVLMISRGRLMSPEATWLLWTHLVVVKCCLSLNQRAETDIAELLLKILSCLRGIWVIPVSVLVDLLDLPEPLKLQTSVLLHCISHLFWQVRRVAASKSAKKTILWVERFKSLRVVLHRLKHTSVWAVHVCHA